MSDTTNLATTDDPTRLPGTPEQRAEEDLHGMKAIKSSDLPMLPGEIRPHPSPFQYVMIAVILCVITGLEVGMYYLTDSIPRALYITILLAMAVTKFVIVVSWFMHLRVDRPIFRRLFIVGSTGAILLYSIILFTLHVYE